MAQGGNQDRRPRAGGAVPSGRGTDAESGRPAFATSRGGARRGRSFTLALTIGFAASALVTVLLLFVVLFFIWEGSFQRYTRSNIEGLAQATAAALAESYAAQGDQWNDQSLEAATLASNASNDIGVQVLNEKGTVIYDDTWNHEGAYLGTESPAISLAPTDADSTVSVPITAHDVQVGTVRVWAYGSDALITQNDAIFRDDSYRAILVSAIASVMIASLAGFFIARSLTRPLRRIARTAQAIRNGDLTARTGLRGNDEIGALGETFDDMATSLERDLTTEHRLTSDVAHELRTPLMAMLVNVEAMQDGVLPADPEHLGLVASEVKRLSRLVDAMLQLSRMQNGTTPLHQERIDVIGMVRDLVQSQEQLFEDKDLTLEFKNESGAPEVYADLDRDMIQQVVVNLLSNALRYTPEGGSVITSVGQDWGDVIIAVTDTGIGIAQEDLPRVFTRFWRSDASRERVSGGLGVGLSLVREIVSRHGGYVSVNSTEGEGTTFTVHLPKVKGRTSHREEPPQRAE